MWTHLKGRWKHYQPPAWWSIRNAAKILEMPFAELLNHPEREGWMELASRFAAADAILIPKENK